MATAYAVGASRSWLRRIARGATALARRIDPRAALVAGAAVAAIPLIAVEASIGGALYGVQPALAFGLAVVHAGCVPLATRRPRVAAVLAAVATLALQLLSLGQDAHAWPWWVVLVVTQTLVVLIVALRAAWPVAVAAWISPVVASSVLAATLPRPERDAASIDIVVFTSVSGGVLVLALALVQWRGIRAQLVRERQVSAEEHSRLMLAEERARIARELHDVIAHSMSIISVQATTAKYRNPHFGDAAIAEFDEIGTSSRQALDEMRGLLGVLRDGRERGALVPQPRFDDIPELVAQAERAGIAVRFEWRDGATVGEVTGLAAYRIVQEALSNAIRHAPGACVTVRCAIEVDSVVIDVLNDRAADPTAAEDRRAPGHGLVGMAERASSVGGTLSTTRTDDGGFAVHAELPVRPS